MRATHRIALRHLVAFVVALPGWDGVHAATFAPTCNNASLFTALTTANGNGQDNTVNLPAGCTYTIAVPTSFGSDTLGNALPVINSPHVLTINGNNAIIERSLAGGTPDFRLLLIDGSAFTGTAHITVTINDLVLRNGQLLTHDSSGVATGVGGAIYSAGYSSDIGVDGTLTLNNVTLSNNSVDAYGGGVIALGYLNINGSLVTGNTAATFGGGVAVQAGYLSVQRSSISANQQNPGSTDPGFISGGGGIGCFLCASALVQDSIIENNTSAGTGGGGIAALASAVDIRRTRVAGNSATAPTTRAPGLASGNAGGIGLGSETGFSASPSTISDSAIYNNSASDSAGGVGANGPVSLTISNSTISGNHAGVRGGGVGDAATAVGLVNVTVAGNSAPRSAGIDIGSFVDPNGTTVGKASFANSVIGGNSGSSDCYNDGGSITGNATSLLQIDATAANACDGAGGTHFALRADPLLSPLAKHGGPDLSHLPLAGSPLIGTGNVAVLPGGTALDQRGVGFPRVVAGKTDLGAIEAADTDVIFRNSVEFH